MSVLKIVFALIPLLVISASGSKCSLETTTRHVVCYYKSENSINNLNICNCTHIIFTNTIVKGENYSLEITEDTKNDLSIAKERKNSVLTLFTFESKPEESSAILKSENRSQQIISEIKNLLNNYSFDGVELDFKFNSQDGVSKESYTSFIKDLSKSLSLKHLRVKREGYDVFEKLQDDVTTAAYSTQSPKNSTSKTQSIIRPKKEKSRRKTREDNDGYTERTEDFDEVTEEQIINDSEEQNTIDEQQKEENQFLIFVRLSIEPEIIAKKFDLKAISRYANILTVPTHNIVGSNGNLVTYHPSRLMGLSDILNTDSILDFLTGMGALKSKIVITMPATVLKFQLNDAKNNTPGSPAISTPEVITQAQLCTLFKKNNWTLERDEDLTAPYAFSGKDWLAFEDGISINIKGKYILLRELAGGAIYPIDADITEKSCTNRNKTIGYLTSTLYRNFRNLERKPRALVFESLQEEIHDTTFSGIDKVKLSEYRIVRVVDHSGAVHVVRKNTKTQFECSRQGYFSHPLGCNMFYRCVKFDQYSDDFTVFEYNCPAGLAFDERWEVCVWPGSLPNGSPCTGSSEIAPVPRSHYKCPNQEGYYADPENCRWFFACLDHARDGITPLTAYEFRCPFGLVFDEGKLACDWPWLVGGCGNRGSAGFLNTGSGGSSSTVHSTFINAGNLESSLGQYGNGEQRGLHGKGRGFGSVLKETNGYESNVNSYQGAQNAGFDYIASQYDDNQNRASFATLPDYEISGGRILNKEGVILQDNINILRGVKTSNNGAISELNNVNGQKNVFGGYKNIKSTITETNGGQYNIPSVTLHNIESVQGTAQSLGGLSNAAQFSYQPTASTPKPFLVGVPSVEVNEGENSGYVKHPSGRLVTTQRVPTKVSISKEVVHTKSFRNGNSHLASQGFATERPTVLLGASVTPGTVSFGSTVTGNENSHFASQGFSTKQPTVLLGASVTPGTVINSLGSTVTGNENSHFASQGFSTKQPTVLLGASVTPGTVINSLGSTATGSENLHFTSQGFSTKQPTVLLGASVTPGTVINSFESTVAGNKKFSDDVSVSSPTKSYEFVTPTPNKFEKSNYKKNEFIGGVSLVQPSISTAIPGGHIEESLHVASFGKNSISNGGTISQPNSVSLLNPTSGVHTFEHTLSEQKITSHLNPGQTVFEQAHSSSGDFVSQGFSQTDVSRKPVVSIGIPVVTPSTLTHVVDNTKFGSGVALGDSVVNLQKVTNDIPVVTSKPSIYTQTSLEHTGRINIGSDSNFGIPVGTLKTQEHGFQQIGKIHDSISGLNFNKQNTYKQTGTIGVSSAPDFGLSFSTPKTTLHGFQQTTKSQENISGFKFNNKGGYKQKESFGVSGSPGFAPSVTPKTEIHGINQVSNGQENIYGLNFNIHNNYDQTAGFGSNDGIKFGHPSVGSKTVIQSTHQTGNAQDNISGLNFNKHNTYGQGGSGGIGKIEFGIPLVTQKTEIHTIPVINNQDSISGLNFNSQNTYGQSGNIGTSGKVEIGITSVTPKTLIHSPQQTFNHQETISGLNINNQDSYGQKGSGTSGGIVYGVPAVTPKTEISFQQTRNEQGSITSVNLNEPVGVYQVPVTAQKTEIHSFGYKNSGSSGISGIGSNQGYFGAPKSEIHGTVQTVSGIGGVDVGGAPLQVSKVVSVSTPKTTYENISGKNKFSGVSFQVPVSGSGSLEHVSLNQDVKDSAGFIVNSPGISSYSTPTIVPKTIIHTSDEIVTGQKEFAQSFDKTHYNVPQTIQKIQPDFDHKFSYSTTYKPIGNDISTPSPIASFSQGPKLETFGQHEISSVKTPTVLTQTFYKQQPTVSFGSVTSKSYEYEASTPKPFTQNYDTQSSVSNKYNKVNFKSTFSSAKPTVSVVSPTSVPVVSLIDDQNQPTVLQGDEIFGKTATILKQQDVNIQSIQHSSPITTPAPEFHQSVVTTPADYDQKFVKLSSFNPFTVQASTPRPFVFNHNNIATGTTKSSIHEQVNLELSPVTPSAGVLISKNEQTVDVLPSQPFVQSHKTVEAGQAVFIPKSNQPTSYQNFDFVRTKPQTYNAEQDLGNVQHKAKPSISTADFSVSTQQPVVITSKPFTPQKFSHAEKPSEINQIQFFPSPSSEPATGRPNVVQQSFNVFKTQSNKEAVRPFYEQTISNEGKEVAQTQINTIPVSGGDIFGYPQNLNVQGGSFKGRKQILTSAVTQTSQPYPVSYTTAKTTILREPVTHFAENDNSYTLGVSSVNSVTQSYRGFKTESENQAGGIFSPVGGIKQVTETGFIEQYENSKSQVPVVHVSSPEIPLGVTIQASQNVPSSTQDISIQPHSNFEFHKVGKENNEFYKENILFQPKVLPSAKPQLNDFQSSGQVLRFDKTRNFTKGIENSLFGSGFKYSINPNIEIPEPPKEYLEQNVYISGGGSNLGGQFKSSIDFKTPSYSSSTENYSVNLLQKRPLKTTIISRGNVNEQEKDVQKLLDEHSGGFGQILNKDNEQFITKVINEHISDELNAGNLGSSTVVYEEVSGRENQRGRGRQYHGGLTAGVSANRNYEGFEIEKEGQRNTNFGKYNSENDEESSKTTVDLKNIKLDKNKKTVVIISQVSDSNPLLLGKLAGQCSCQSNMLEIRNKGKAPKRSKQRKFNSQGYRQQNTLSRGQSPVSKGINLNNEGVELLLNKEISSSTVFPDVQFTGSSEPLNGEVSFTAEQSFISSSTTPYPVASSTAVLSSLGENGVLPITPKSLFTDGGVISKKKQFRGKTRYVPPSFSEDGSPIPLLSPVPASEIASTLDYGVLKGDESRTQNEINGRLSGQPSRVSAGAAYDRYGPGGWRGFDETLQGSVDCKRPGLFRHPKYCNKFYACNYDPWKEGYTLHVFNCPIRLTYDSSISACNWPVGGPSCADDNLLV